MAGTIHGPEPRRGPYDLPFGDYFKQATNQRGNIRELKISGMHRGNQG